MADNFDLADRLKKEFSGRGLAAAGTPGASGAPRTNADEATRRSAPSRPANGQNEATLSVGYEYRRTGAGNGRAQDASRPGYRNMNVRHTVSEDIAGRGRARQRNAGKQGSDGRSGETDKNARAASKQKNGQKIRVKHTRAARKRKAAGRGEQEEYRLRRTAVPVSLIAVTLVAVLIIFTLVESLAEVYQTSTDIARMKARRDELKNVAAALELKLDEKNDVRTIREIAVGELGMADEDSMQRRFISVSGGERIELLETEEDAEQAGGVLFSSLEEFINRFLGRFR